MRVRIGAVLLASGAAALTVGMSVTASGAATATTWTVKPGGSVTGVARNVTMTDTATGSVLTCKTMTAKGTAKSGSGLPGAGIASITSVTFTSCVGPDSLTFTVTAGHLPWKLNAKSYNATTGVTKGTITGAEAALSGSGCTATSAGPTPTTPATLVGTYTNSKHQLKTGATGSNMHVWNVSSGCLNLIKSGDPVTLKGTSTLTPAQTITSP
jgi:hypothetical protein